MHVAREAGARQPRAVPPRPAARRRRHGPRSSATRADLARRDRRPRGDRGLRGPRARSSRPHRRDSGMSPMRQAGPRPLAPDAATYRTVLGHFATGVAIITAIDGDEPVGMACNSFTSVSLEPPLVLFCAAKSSTHVAAHPGTSGKWAANILDEDGEAGLPAVRGEGRRPVRAHRVRARPHRRADPRRRARVRRLRDGRRARRRRPRHRGRQGGRARLRSTRASRCSSTAAGTAGSRV